MCEARLFGDVCECPVVVVAKELTHRPVMQVIEGTAVDEEDIDPAVIVIIEQCNPAAEGLHDVQLFRSAASNGEIQMCLSCNVLKMDRSVTGIQTQFSRACPRCVLRLFRRCRSPRRCKRAEHQQEGCAIRIVHCALDAEAPISFCDLLVCWNFCISTRASSCSPDFSSASQSR